MDIIISILAVIFASILAAIIIVVCTTVRSLRERILLLEQVIEDKNKENKKLKMEIYWYLNDTASLEQVIIDKNNEYKKLKEELHSCIKEVLELEGKRSKYYDELKKVYCSSSHWGNVKSWMNDRTYDLIMDPKTLNIPFEEKIEKLFEEHMNNINKK